VGWAIRSTIGSCPQVPVVDRNYYCISMNITTKFSTLKLLFFSFPVVWLLNRFRGFLVPRPDWIKDLYVFGTLGLHRLLTKTLNFFYKFSKLFLSIPGFICSYVWNPVWIETTVWLFLLYICHTVIHRKLQNVVYMKKNRC
jgi:hypothetical protein